MANPNEDDLRVATELFESLPDCDWCGALCPDDAAAFINRIASMRAAQREQVWQEAIQVIRKTPHYGTYGEKAYVPEHLIKALEAAAGNESQAGEKE